jgi:hypothetical protein
LQSKNRAPESDKIYYQKLRKTLTSFRETPAIDKRGDEDGDGDSVHPT